jgi:alpha-L-arabinofuranosidase
MGNYWPLRIARGEWNRGLLQHGTKEPQPVYYAFKAFATMCQGSLVAATTEGPALVYPALSEDAQSLNVFVINPELRQVECDIGIAGFSPAPRAQLHTLTGANVDANNDKDPDAVAASGSPIQVGPSFTLTAPGPSLCVIRLSTM